MSLPWSTLTRFLKFVVPLVPVVLKNVETFRRGRPPAADDKPFEAQLAQLEQALIEQEIAVEKLAERMEQLIPVLDTIQKALRLVLIIAIAALVVAIGAVVLAVTYGK